jgi:DNA transformation protein
MGKSTRRRDTQPAPQAAPPGLEGLKNLSGLNARILQEAGVTSPAQLHELGAVATYVRVKRAGIQASLNLLYALEGAIRDVNWTELPYSVRASLTLEADAFLENEGLR